MSNDNNSGSPAKSLLIDELQQQYTMDARGNDKPIIVQSKRGSMHGHTGSALTGYHNSSGQQPLEMNPVERNMHQSVVSTINGDMRSPNRHVVDDFSNTTLNHYIGSEFYSEN